MHSTFHQAIYYTEASSSDPNLQNIPIKTEEGRMIREAFVAPQVDLISIDYSKLNSHHGSPFKDEGLITAFENGEYSLGDC